MTEDDIIRERQRGYDAALADMRSRGVRQLADLLLGFAGTKRGAAIEAAWFMGWLAGTLQERRDALDAE